MHLEDLKGKLFTHNSACHEISLQILDLEQNEENNDIWKFRLMIDGEDVTKKYFGESNNLNFNLDYFQFASDKSDYVFIPTEGSTFILNVATLNRIALSSVERSTEMFLGNSTRKNQQLTVYHYILFITNMETRESISLSFGDDIIIYCGFCNDEQVMIEHYNRGTKKTTTCLYDITSHSFVRH